MHAAQLLHRCCTGMNCASLLLVVNELHNAAAAATECVQGGGAVGSSTLTKGSSCQATVMRHQR